MLQGMRQPANPTPSPASSTFAAQLAAMSMRPSGPVECAPVWNDDSLADDVTTLSYERALRAHARYRAPEANDRALTQPAEARTAVGAQNGTAAAEAGADAAVLAADREPETAPAASSPTAEDRTLKCASITIRMSKAECEQLRKRAAEAGLTVSAYLRSCTFEAEQLRALVKDTLAELRNEPGHTGNAECAEERRGWRQQLGRFWPHARVQRPIAQA